MAFVVKKNNKNRYLQRLVGIAGLASLSFAASAASWEYVTLRAASSLRYEDNVLRLPDGVTATTPSGASVRSDVIHTNSAGATLDIPLSRQRVQLSYDINRNEYENFTNRDFKGDSKSAMLRWELGARLSGDAGIFITTNQSEIADSISRRPNLRTTTRKFIDARYPLLRQWRVGGGISMVDSVNSDPVNQVSDSSTDGLNFDLRYEPSSGNYLGFRANRIDVSYPNPVVISGVSFDNGYNQKDHSLIAGYAPGGQSSVQLALGQNVRMPNAQVRGQTSGAVGSLDLTWVPAGRTTINLGAKREYARPQDITTDYSVVDSLIAGAGWRLTEKITARVDLSHATRKYALGQSSPVTGLPARSDTTTFQRLSLNYAAHDRVVLSISVRQEQRESTLLGNNYSANTVLASVQVSF